MNAKRRFLILSITAFLAGCGTVFGQTNSGQLTIRVTDTTGAVVPRAQVRMLPRPNTVSDNPETGEYGTVMLSVPPGNYQLFVSFPWFTPWGKKIRVHQGRAETIAVVLENPGDKEIISTGDHKPIDVEGDTTLISAQAAKPPHTVGIAFEVTDSTGAAVPFAQVSVAREQREADKRGTLHLNLVPDAYYVTVTSPSFKRWRERIQVPAAAPLIRVRLVSMDVKEIGSE